MAANVYQQVRKKRLWGIPGPSAINVKISICILESLDKPVAIAANFTMNVLRINERICETFYKHVIVIHLIAFPVFGIFLSLCDYSILRPKKDVNS